MIIKFKFENKLNDLVFIVDDVTLRYYEFCLSKGGEVLYKTSHYFSLLKLARWKKVYNYIIEDTGV